jgi:hypothetical protein
LELLNELYIQQFGKQPMKREETAGGKSVERVMSGDEVREELTAKQEVTEVELRQLAQSRAGRIREFLVGDQANQGQQESRPNQENQVNQDDKVDQEKQVKQENQQIKTEETTQEDQVDQAKQDNQGKEAGQEDHMRQDRVFLLEVELSGAHGEQVRCQLNLTGA